MCEGDHGIFSEGKFMSILDKSSLVMIPSGYKEDVLYSVKPRNGEGDFTFTRASTGTRVNADGYIEEVPWNLNTYSEDFTNSSYIKDSGIIVGSTDNISPIGNNTATQINVTNSGRIYKNVTSGAYRTSVYLKAGTFAYFKFANSQIDLILGTISSPYSSSIEDVGNGWYRISVSFLTTIRPFQVQAYPDNTYTTHTQSGNYFIWGSMLNYGDTTKPYIKTTDRLDVPRLDYTGGATTPTLLLEGQRTNTVLNSEDISQNTILNNASVTTDQTTSPSNIDNADKITFGSGSGFFYKQTTISAASTFSVFLKYDDYQYFQLMGTGDVDHYANFDIQNGVLGNVGSQATAKIEDYGNGWYRCSLSMYAGTFAGAQRVYKTTSLTASWAGGGGGAGSVFAWGIQLESGIYATSYIPTNGTSVTRVADVSETSGLSDYIGQLEGSFIIDFKCPAGGGGQIYIWNGTIQERLVINVYTNNTRIDALAVVENSLVANENLFDQDTTQRTIYGIRYRENDFEIWVNGVLKATETGTFSFWSAGTLDQFDFNDYNNNAKFVGNVNKVIFTTTYPTDEEMQKLTTI